MLVYPAENELERLSREIQSVDIFRQGKITHLDRGDKIFDKLLGKVKAKLENARILPALAVGIHEEVEKEIQKGLWIQINFGETKTVNDLPFDSLLIKAEVGNGYNLIRKYNGEYGGRCIYVYIDE